MPRLDGYLNQRQPRTFRFFFLSSGGYSELCTELSVRAARLSFEITPYRATVTTTKSGSIKYSVAEIVALMDIVAYI